MNNELWLNDKNRMNGLYIGVKIQFITDRFSDFFIFDCS